MLKLQYFGHLMGRADSVEKTLVLGKTEGRRKRAQQRMKWLDDISDSLQPHGLQCARLLCPLLKFMFIELMMLSNHLILYHPLLLLSSILLSIKESANIQ